MRGHGARETGRSRCLELRGGYRQPSFCRDARQRAARLADPLLLAGRGVGRRRPADRLARRGVRDRPDGDLRMAGPLDIRRPRQGFCPCADAAAGIRCAVRCRARPALRERRGLCEDEPERRTRFGKSPRPGLHPLRQAQPLCRARRYGPAPRGRECPFGGAGQRVLQCHSARRHVEFRGGPLARTCADDLRTAHRLCRRHARGRLLRRFVAHDGRRSLPFEQHLQRRRLRRPPGDSRLGPPRIRRFGVGAGRRGRGSLAVGESPVDARRPGRARDGACQSPFVRRYGLGVRLRRQPHGPLPPAGRGRARHADHDDPRRVSAALGPYRDAQPRYLLQAPARLRFPDRHLYFERRRPRDVDARFHLPRIPVCRTAVERPGEARQDESHGAFHAHRRAFGREILLLERAVQPHLGDDAPDLSQQPHLDTHGLSPA